MNSNLSEYFSKYHVRYVEYPHQAVHTVAESLDLKKKIPGLHCKALFLKDDKGKFYLIGMPAKKRLDIKKLRTGFSVKKLHFASEEDLWQKLSLKPGSVSIFAMIYPSAKQVMLILDKTVWDADYVGFHPNINTSTLVLAHADLERFYNSIAVSKCVIAL